MLGAWLGVEANCSCPSLTEKNGNIESQHSFRALGEVPTDRKMGEPTSPLGVSSTSPGAWTQIQHDTGADFLHSLWVGVRELASCSGTL